MQAHMAHAVISKMATKTLAPVDKPICAIQLRHPFAVSRSYTPNQIGSQVFPDLARREPGVLCRDAHVAEREPRHPPYRAHLRLSSAPF
jgi:hypothetical protein